MKYFAFSSLLTLAVVGCGSDMGAARENVCLTGSESCACYPNNTCDSGLDCRSHVCVVLAPRGGSGGVASVGLAGTAGNAGSAQSATKANGEICTVAGECSSGICDESGNGEKHCYGKVMPDGLCRDTFDCNGGLCITQSLVGNALVCNEGVRVCLNRHVSEECTTFVIDFCNLIQSCGSRVSSAIPPAYASLDQCVRSECTSEEDGTGDHTPAQCLAVSAAILNGSAPCP